MRLWKLLVSLGVLLAGGWGALTQIPLELPRPAADVVHLPERLLTRWLPPSKGKVKKLTPEEREVLQRLGGRLDARIVWSSNRDGNHDLYLMDLRSQEVRRLTRHPNVDFFSRFSPDGQRIVFLRSQREWVSFREESAWDVYLLDLKTNEERLLAPGGYHPTWTADGRVVIFNRGARVFRYDLAAERETVIFDGQKEVPGVTEIGDFELGPDNRRLAFGLRGPFAGAAVFDLEARTLTPLSKVQACQTTWAPDGQSLVWIEIEGNGGTRVMTGGADGSGRRVLMDLPGRYSHEYFPKLSNDGRWLIWGAAAEGHEHDRADYEIFLWELGTPWEKAIRLTYYTGNDQWPDVYIPANSASRHATETKGTRQ